MSDERSVACPGCGKRVSMIAAAGKDQRWGVSIKPGETGMLQAATVAGVIDGGQKLMRLTCREDGVNANTYIERLETLPDGTIEIAFVTLPVSKKWAKANGRAP